MAQETNGRRALPFTQNGRHGWTTNLTVRELLELVPPRDPSQWALYTEANRPLIERHVRTISDYLERTAHWALPPITLACSTGMIDHESDCIKLTAEQFSVLDGQHRLEALNQTLSRLTSDREEEESEAGADKPNPAETLLAQEIPITVMEVSSVEDQRQLFAWFARSRSVDASTRTYMDQSDPYNNAARSAMQASNHLKRLTTYEIARIRAGTNYLTTLTQLKELGEVIITGIQRGPNRIDRQKMEDQGQQALVADRLMTFFDAFLPGCGEKYAILYRADFPLTSIPILRNDSLAYDHPILRLVANAWARWTIDQGQQPGDMATVIAALDLKKSNPENDAAALQVVHPETGKYLGARDRAWNEATTTLLTRARSR